MKQVPLSKVHLSKPISKFHDSNVLRKCGSETRKDYQNSYASLERKNQDIQPKSSTFHINRKLLQDLSNHIPVGVTLAWLKGGNATSVRLDEARKLTDLCEKYARASPHKNENRRDRPSATTRSPRCTITRERPRQGLHEISRQRGPADSRNQDALAT